MTSSSPDPVDPPHRHAPPPVVPYEAAPPAPPTRPFRRVRPLDVLAGLFGLIGLLVFAPMPLLDEWLIGVVGPVMYLVLWAACWLAAFAVPVAVWNRGPNVGLQARSLLDILFVLICFTPWAWFRIYVVVTGEPLLPAPD